MKRQDGSLTRSDIGWAPTYAQEKLPIKIGSSKHAGCQPHHASPVSANTMMLNSAPAGLRQGN
jgi:hypothetical protein